MIDDDNDGARRNLFIRKLNLDFVLTVGTVYLLKEEGERWCGKQTRGSHSWPLNRISRQGCDFGRYRSLSASLATQRKKIGPRLPTVLNVHMLGVQHSKSFSNQTMMAVLIFRPPWATYCGISISSCGNEFGSVSILGVSSSGRTSAASTPVISISPIGRPCLSVNVSISGWSIPSAFTRAITTSGIGMTVQLRRTIFIPVFSALNFWPPWQSNCVGQSSFRCLVP